MFVFIPPIINFVRPVLVVWAGVYIPSPSPLCPFCINKTLWRWPPFCEYIDMRNRGVEKQILLNGGYWPGKILYNSPPSFPPPPFPRSPTQSAQGRDTCVLVYQIFVDTKCFLLMQVAFLDLLLLSGTPHGFCHSSRGCAWYWVHSHAPSIRS
jgi:hypothetical protein